MAVSTACCLSTRVMEQIFLFVHCTALCFCFLISPYLIIFQVLIVKNCQIFKLINMSIKISSYWKPVHILGSRAYGSKWQGLKSSYDIFKWWFLWTGQRLNILYLKIFVLWNSIRSRVFSASGCLSYVKLCCMHISAIREAYVSLR